MTLEKRVDVIVENFISEPYVNLFLDRFDLYALLKISYLRLTSHFGVLHETKLMHVLTTVLTKFHGLTLLLQNLKLY